MRLGRVADAGANNPMDGRTTGIPFPGVLLLLCGVAAMWLVDRFSNSSSCHRRPPQQQQQQRRWPPQERHKYCCAACGRNFVTNFELEEGPAAAECDNCVIYSIPLFVQREVR